MDLSALIQQCTPANVSTQTMHALMRVESAHRPHAIGYKVVKQDGTVFTLTKQPRDVAEAISWAKWMLASGYKFDAGAAQVNSINFNRFGVTPENMFDACTSINVGARILTECYTRAYGVYKEPQRALNAALSCYQSGNFKTGFGTGYVARVNAAAGVTDVPGAGAPPLRRESTPRHKGSSGGAYSAKNKIIPYAESTEVSSFRNAGASETSTPSPASKAVSSAFPPVIK